MIDNFQGKTAVLTGAGSGFGLECARIGAQLGMNLVLVDLPLETLVLCSDRGRAVLNQVGLEQRRILLLAANPISLAEISAHLDVVIGATRVLVGDLVASGFLESRSGSYTEQPDIQLLERVLDGLKALLSRPAPLYTRSAPL